MASMNLEIIILMCLPALSIALRCDANDCISQCCPHNTDVGQCLSLEIFTFTFVEICLSNSFADASNQILRLSKCCGTPSYVNRYQMHGTALAMKFGAHIDLPVYSVEQFPRMHRISQWPFANCDSPQQKPRSQTSPVTGTIVSRTLGSGTTVRGD
jgi:hypothetical protein